MHGVDRMSTNHVHDDAGHIAPDFLQPWIEQLGAIGAGNYPIGVRLHDVAWRMCVGVVLAVRPVGVEPGMQFHPPVVDLGNCEIKRVVQRIGGHALSPREPVGPGLN